jgi:hypothetical protein
VSIPNACIAFSTGAWRAATLPPLPRAIVESCWAASRRRKPRRSARRSRRTSHHVNRSTPGLTGIPFRRTIAITSESFASTLPIHFDKGMAMMPCKNLRRMTAVLLLVFGPFGASATTLTYSFDGTLSTSFGTLNAGDAFTGSYTIDASLPPAITGGFGTTTFALWFNVISATLQIESFTATSTAGVIQQIDDPTGDQYNVDSGNSVGSSQIGGLDMDYFLIRLFDSTGPAVVDASELLTDPLLSDFDFRTFVVVFGPSDNSASVVGTLTSLAVVPEPSTMALLGVGLAGLARRRRTTEVGLPSC